MASIRVRTRTDGSIYSQVRYRIKGQESSVSFDDHTAAVAFKKRCDDIGPAEALRLAGIEQSTHNEITLAEWCTEYCDHLTGIQDESINRYRAYIRNDLGDIGGMPLSAVEDTTIKRWIKAMKDSGASAKTIKNKHGFLSGAMNGAVAAGRINRNPCEHTKLYRSDTDEMVFLEREEFDLIHSHMTDRWKPLFVWLVCTGTRFSEATALTINDVNVDQATARINKAWKYSTTGRVLGLTKSRKGQRTINLPPQALEILDLSRDRTALLFPTESGGRISAQLAWNKGWGPARRKAIEKDGLEKNPRIHDLRHTCASWMINAGVSLPIVQAHLGHESIQTTMDRYGHLDRNAGKTAAAAIAKMMA